MQKKLIISKDLPLKIVKLYNVKFDQNLNKMAKYFGVSYYHMKQYLEGKNLNFFVKNYIENFDDKSL